MRLLYKRESPTLKRELFGITFPNPVGLAAGLDKNGNHYNELSDCGFSFIEIGSLTPEPQKGNPKPRVFRVVNDEAIINRMGINNCGVRNAIASIQANKPEVILAASLAKNSNSVGEDEIIHDYETDFSLMYDFADMFVLNISCPNVEGTEALQDIDLLSDIVDHLLDLRLSYEKYKPLLLKISPDIPHSQLNEILDYCRLSGIDGIIACNTTRKRDGLTLNDTKLNEIGNGGLSGAPLFGKSLSMVKYISEYTKGRLPIIGVGGIMTPEQAAEMLDAGASLIELYSGFIYEGPSLVKHIIKYLEKTK
jgi:dihydroorotate dehydrogenase